MTSPFNLQTLTLSKDSAKITIFSSGRHPKPMREHASMLKVVGFIQNKMGISLQGNSRYDWMTTVKTELDMVTAYHNLYKREDKIYTTAHSLGKIKWGRTNPANNLSLNIMHRPTRHALCDSIYADKDMQNAHVSFLCQTFKDRTDVDISALQDYNSDPKKWRGDLAIHHGLDPVKDKDVTKQLFIRVLFGGTYEQWINDFDINKNIKPSEQHPLVLKIENQLGKVRELFFEANPQLAKDMIKHDPKKYKCSTQLKRSLLAIALQTLERWIMESCVQFLIDEKGFDLEDIVPCQDGMMILKHLDYAGIEADFEKVTFETFGLSIGWVDKAFDEAIEIPDGIIERTLEQWNELITDDGLAHYLLAIHGDRIKYKRSLEHSADALYIFDGERKRWFLESSKNPPTLLNLISKIHPILRQEINTDSSLSEKEIKLLQTKALILLSTTGGERILKKILSNAQWCDCGFDKVPYYLGFENGFLDLRTHTFEEYREDVYITISTGYDYVQPDYENNEQDRIYRDELANIFDMMFTTTEETIYYLQIMASGLDAINYQYIWFFEGAGGNGKSMGVKLNETVLGNAMYKASSGSILTVDAEKANQSSEDLCHLINARTVVFSEMDKTSGMTWSALKILTGGDTITGRRLYQGILQFSLNSSLICTFNSRPDMVGNVVGAERASLERRLKPMHFPRHFTENENDIATNPEKFIRANPTYTTDAWRNAVRHVYLDLLCGVYKAYYSQEEQRFVFNEPATVREACNEYLRGEDLFLEMYDEIYAEDANKLLNLKHNRVYLGDMYATLTRHELFVQGSQGTGKKAFLRTWNKKAFIGWCRGKFEVQIDTRVAKEYVLGVALKSDLEYAVVEEEGHTTMETDGGL